MFVSGINYEAIQNISHKVQELKNHRYTNFALCLISIKQNYIETILLFQYRDPIKFFFSKSEDTSPVSHNLFRYNFVQHMVFITVYQFLQINAHLKLNAFQI